MNDRLQEALDVCLGRLRQDGDIERCLAQYPELAHELRPLLELAGKLLAARIDPPPSPDGLARQRERLLSALASDSGAGVQGQAAGAHGSAQSSVQDTEMAVAIDRCLERIRAGESPAEAAAEYPSLERDLKPILEFAAIALAELESPPPAPHGLELGRKRFTEAVSAVRVELEDRDEAVDAIVAQAISGDQLTPFTPGQGLPPAALETAAALSELAARMAAERVSAPPPPSGLARARQRFIAAADAARAHGAAREEHMGRRRRPTTSASSRDLSLGAIERLREWLAPVRPVAIPRFAMVTVGVLLALIVSSTSLSPAVSAAIPGDALYPVKRMGESLQLLVARDEAQKEALHELFSERRDQEIDQATAAGRVTEVSWRVRLEGVDPQGETRGLSVWPLASDPGQPQRRVLEIDPDTSWRLGAFDRIEQVPRGSILEVVVRTRPSDPSGLPLAVAVTLVEAVEPVPTPAVRERGEERAIDQAEPTAARTPTPAVTAASTALPASSTPAASPTPTSQPTLVPTQPAAVVKEATKDYSRGLLRGVLDEKVDAATWLVADIDQGGAVVRVDVRELPAEQSRMPDARDGVDLEGRWLSSDHHEFAARDMVGYIPQEELCKPGTAAGTVTDYVPGSYLVLSDNREFLMSGLAKDAIGGVAPLEIGAEVVVYFVSCRNVERVDRISVVRGASGPARETGTASPPGVPYQGTVERIVEPGARFRMLGDDGRLYTVLYDGDTPITGEAAEIRWQQEVGVYGWLEGDVITAQSIVIYADAPPTATRVPALTPTPTEAIFQVPVITPSEPTVEPTVELPSGVTS